MKRNLILATILAGAFLATSCKTRQKSKADDDFYDFDKQETTYEKPAETNKKKEIPYTPSDGRYTRGNSTSTVSSSTVNTANTSVRSRMEKVEIVRGAIDYDAKYFIILGSFSKEANANKLVGRLAQQGFAPNVLRSPSGMYRVSGYYFNDERAARMEVAEIRKKYPEYNDLWLLIKK
ncbi:MAG: SPOR domain-containing protein [Flavobacteriaceae bacterium]|nr:SPOR domain-containing protein [Flavobacteriaceae bacterium]